MITAIGVTTLAAALAIPWTVLFRMTRPRPVPRQEELPFTNDYRHLH